MRGNDPSRVLVVDGDEAVSESLAAVLDNSVTVVAETSHTAALDRLTCERIDCVVGCHPLPDGDGVELLRTVRDRYGQIPFVLAPQEGSDRLASEAVAADVTEYVPFDGNGVPERLLTRVEAVLDGDRSNHAVGVTSDTNGSGSVERSNRSASVEQSNGSDGIERSNGNGRHREGDRSERRTRQRGDGAHDAVASAEASDTVEIDARESDRRWNDGSESTESGYAGDGLEIALETLASDERSRRMIESIRLEERALTEAPIGITIATATEPERPLIYVNDAFEELTGYSKSEALGRNCRFLQGPGTDPMVVAEMRAGLDAAVPVSVELLNYRKDGVPFWNKVDIAPIADESGTVTHFVGFQTDITRRKEAEFTAKAHAADVREEHEHLEHVLERLHGLVNDITEVLVAAATRNEVELAVCERVAATHPYRIAWLGALEPGRNDVRIRGWACRDDGEVTAGDGSEITVPPSTVDVAREAIESGNVVVVERDEIARDELIEAEAFDDGETLTAEETSSVVDDVLDAFDSMAVVPLSYRETDYGVLAVCTTGSFDERDTSVLEALGRAIATALNAVESRRVLTADNVGDLELTLTDPSLFFVALSERADCRLEYAGSVVEPDGGTAMFFSVEGAAPEAIEAVVDDCPEIAAVTVLSEQSGASLVEFKMAEESIVSLLASFGTRTRSIVVENGRARLRLTLPADGDAQSILDRLTERYDGTEFGSYQERTRPTKTKREYLASVRERLTDRQYTALQRAYIGGYFRRPRPVTGDELAESMGISRATFHQHLVTAERKLLEEFFDD